MYFCNMKTEKVILITGASSGIGFDAAETLAKQGHRVYAAARRVERMEPLKDCGVRLLKMDVTDDDSMKHGVEEVLRAEGRIDVLINNAGYGQLGAIENVSLEEARRQVEVNLFGLARLTQLVLPVMRQQGSGRIVNTSSVAGKIAIFLGGWYNVTKFAVEGFSDALRMEMKPFGIDVVKIEPGAIRTNWGSIAVDSLKKSSAGTAYEAIGNQWADSINWFYETSIGSSPSVVTRAISRAVNKRHPRMCYRVGRFAGVGVFFHAILPARWWDAMMWKLGKIKVKQQ